jgi:hypothetical protein
MLLWGQRRSLPGCVVILGSGRRPLRMPRPLPWSDTVRPGWRGIGSRLMGVIRMSVARSSCETRERFPKEALVDQRPTGCPGVKVGVVAHQPRWSQ